MAFDFKKEYKEFLFLELYKFEVDGGKKSEKSIVGD